mgnify:CR=1 FL=1
MLEGMHHVAVIASEEARTLDFYVNKLGFTLESQVWRIWYWSCSSSPTLLPG